MTLDVSEAFSNDRNKITKVPRSSRIVTVYETMGGPPHRESGAEVSRLVNYSPGKGRTTGPSAG